MTFSDSITPGYDERQRILAIQGLGKKMRVPNHIIDQSVSDGETLEDFKATCLRWVERSASQPIGAMDTNWGAQRAQFNIQYSQPINMNLSKKEIGQYSLAKAINAASEGPHKLEGFEREIHDQLYSKIPQAQRAKTRGVLIPAADLDWGFSSQKRSFYNSRGTLNTQDFSEGGALVPTDHLADRFIDSLKNRSRVLSLGPTILPGLQGDVSIPKNVGDVSTFWIAENSVIPESEMDFGQVNLKPKTIGTIASFSRNLAMQSDPSIENILKKSLVSQLAIGLDRAMLFGSGQSGQPLGIAQTPGIQSVEAGAPDGGPLSYELLAEMEAKIFSENADGEAMAWLVNSKARKSARTTTENSSNVSKWIWTDTGNGDGEMLGHRALLSENVPSNLTKAGGTNLSALFFGNWSDLLFGQWGTIELLPNLMGRTFQTGGIELRILFSCDFAVRNPESFCVCTDLAA
jgi:HK97 family phage major capsid protein